MPKIQKVQELQAVDKIFNLFSIANPLPTTELIYSNNFTLLVAVILSAQATDVSVNKATKELFTNYDTAEKMLKLGEEGLKYYIKSIGLFNSKAKNIIATSKILLEQYQGIVPSTFEELVKLPGVGRKTANVILSTAFDQDVIAVDTHVFRVSKRLGLAVSTTTEAVEAELMQNIPAKWIKHAHHWLILHGRYICKAQKPACNKCPVREYCPSTL